MPKKKSPQEQLSAFWSSFHSRSPGKVTSIFPRALYANLLPSLDANHPKWRTNEHSTSRNAQESYEAAARECRARVRRIVRECERTNEKFTDPDFDIERDPNNNCLNRLIRDDAQVVANDQYIDNDPQAAPGMATTTSRESCDAKPVLQNCRPGAGVEYSFGSIHRVDWIFENPQFTINGFSSSDIKQGSAGDCWWLAAIATIAHRRDLMDRVCVARDEECGVYGFVSEALYFARCDDPNETWLPLLEKAFAKCHGDYESLTGGWPGEAVEDMTGGVTTTVMSNRVLRRDKLWRELASTDGGFVFSLAAMGSSCYSERNGIAMSHAYSILQSREESDEEGRRVRLVKIRNPWGQRTERGLGEWAGAWSDGSKEWTPYWLAKLGHEFGDDGVFWMSFDDMLQTFSHIHRTRLFDERWTVVQRWTAAHVAWVTGYLRSKFVLEVKEAGLVVLVLAQLDDRYFEGFAGGYSYELHFTLQKAGAGKGGQSDQICRVRPAHDMENRSVSCEVELEAGRYEVLPKITAMREKDALSVGDLVKKYADVNPQKLRQVGMQYDLAHAKGGVPDEDGMLESKKTELKRKKAEKKKRMADKKQKAKAEKQKQRTLRRAKRAMRKAKKAIDEVVNGNDSGDGVNEAQCRKTNTNTTIDTNGEQETKDIDSSQAAKRINDDPVDNPTSTADSTAIEQESKHDVDELAKLIDDIAKPADDETTPPTTAAVIPTLLTPPSQSPASQSGGEEQEATAAAQSAETEAATETEKPDSEDSESGSSSESDTESDTDSDSSHDSSDDAETPWNAVCVIGLRVYARDPSVSVSLVKPDDDFEGAALTVDGEPAGATM
ncbi:hypothetical protein BN1708_003573, partial [Verticillium longisporum]